MIAVNYRRENARALILMQCGGKARRHMGVY